MIEFYMLKYGEEPPTKEMPVSETRRYKYHLINTVPCFDNIFNCIFITNLLAIIPKQKAISEKQILSNVVNFVV